MRHFLKIAGVLLLLVGAQRALSQSDSEHLRRGARVFVEKMDGFEDNFAAALHAKQVPVIARPLFCPRPYGLSVPAPETA
jgi:hypothetical protein